MTKKHLTFCAATAAGAIAFTGLTVAPASADTNDQRSALTAAADQMHDTGTKASGKASQALSTALDGLSSTKRSAKAVTSDSDYFLRDTYSDDYYDTYATPGLLGASVAVPRSNGSTMLGVGLLDTYSSGYDTVSGSAALLIDANADGSTDYIAMTPASYMSLDTGYQAPITKRVGSSWVSTGQTATWLRGSDYYGVAFDWKALGVKNIQWSFGTMDSYDNTDFAPDDYGTPIDLGQGQSITPPPTGGGETVQSLPSKVGKITVTKRKGRTKLDWANTPSAYSYRVKILGKGAKYKTWGYVSSSKVTLKTKPGKYYSIEITAENGLGYGKPQYKSFTSR